MSQVMDTLGDNINRDEIIRFNDFDSLRQVVEKELQRRAKTYTPTTITGSFVTASNAQKIFNNLKILDSNKFKAININTITKAATYDEAIVYLKTLMQENLRKNYSPLTTMTYANARQWMIDKGAQYQITEAELAR